MKILDAPEPREEWEVFIPVNIDTNTIAVESLGVLLQTIKTLRAEVKRLQKYEPPVGCKPREIA